LLHKRLRFTLHSNKYKHQKHATLYFIWLKSSRATKYYVKIITRFETVIRDSYFPHALTALVEWQEGHPTCKVISRLEIIPMVSSNLQVPGLICSDLWKKGQLNKTNL